MSFEVKKTYNAIKRAGYATKIRYDKLNEKEQSLVLWNPIDTYKVANASMKAIAETKAIFGKSEDDDVSDAYRHCRWQQLATESVGGEMAKKWGDAHESDTKNTEEATAMDIFNNAAGRSFAGLGDNACSEALSLNALIVLNKSK